MSRLNDLKNCEYHRAKTKQILDDYHTCVEENLRLKEINMKITQQKKSLEAKLDLTSRKLQQLLDTNFKNVNSNATFAITNKVMNAVASESKSLAMTSNPGGDNAVD